MAGGDEGARNDLVNIQEKIPEGNSRSYTASRLQRSLGVNLRECLALTQKTGRTF